MQELHPGDQTWYISEDGITLEQLPFIDPRTGAPSAKEDFKPAEGRLSYTRSPSEARDRICRALGIGRAASPLGKKFNEVFQMGTSMDEIPNFREFLYQYILPQPELDLEALQGDRLELENLHAVLAEAQTRADALEEIDPANKDAYAANAASYLEKLAALDGEYQAVVDNAVRKTVLFGDRFPFRYLVDDYGLSYYAAFAGCSAETEAGFDTITFLAGKTRKGLLPVLTDAPNWKEKSTFRPQDAIMSFFARLGYIPNMARTSSKPC
jgi:hypothetical protein